MLFDLHGRHTEEQRLDRDDVRARRARVGPRPERHPEDPVVRCEGSVGRVPVVQLQGQHRLGAAVIDPVRAARGNAEHEDVRNEQLQDRFRRSRGIGDTVAADRLHVERSVEVDVVTGLKLADHPVGRIDRDVHGALVLGDLVRE